ncbi:hypothetical protein OCA8868_01078 [Octadecabacter ascidiaceicola]|uniref:Uncharacterized protein n=2 Tax=Octadecabacter ascidiaceicola TaxID=1655543 RepID=A0A238K1G5_9RHOB|nr:hypothetical protein OCA8868_01078 [Octadecabacter ascidiaceicola]
MSEADINPVDLRNAKILASVREADPEADAIALEVVTDLPSGGGQSLRDLTLSMGMAARGFRSLIRLIRSGVLRLQQHEVMIVRDQLEINAQDLSAVGYMAVRVSVSELAGKLVGVGVEGFTKAKLKQLLSLNDPAVKFLIEAGYLKATASRNPVTRKAAAVVLPEDYRMFLNRFTPAKRLAEMQGATPRSVMARMRKLGVVPIEMPHGCVGTIYESGKILPEMLS